MLDSGMKLCRNIKYISKVLLVSGALLTCTIYLLYNYHSDKADYESIEKFRPLLEEDLKRAQNPVVIGFQNKNSGSKAGLRYVKFEDFEIKPNATPGEAEEIFFRYVETKDVICGNDVRLGNQHEGGWNVCMSPPFQMVKPCLIYSFGIGGDWRFEDDLYDFYGCQVQAFDPSMGLKQHNRTELMFFRPVGLGTRFEITADGWKLKSFRSILNKEGHSKTLIDYLKFDIEFMEWEVLKSLTKDDILKNVKQIAFEIHLMKPPIKRKAMKKKDFIEMLEILKGLEKIGFRKFNFRMNPFCAYQSGYTGKWRSHCYDIHYLNMDFVEMKHFEKDKYLRAKAV